MTRGSMTLLAPLIAAALAPAAATGIGAQARESKAPLGPGAPTVRTAELSATAKAAIEEALADELRGEAMYARASSEDGDQRPFGNVVRAERRHVAFLRELLEARGLAVPATAVDAPRHATLAEACSAAVEYETSNAALYDRLLAAGPLPQDVKQVFEHNRAASRDRHRPAFERCAGLGATRGAGPGVGRGFSAGRGFGAGQGFRAGRKGGPGCAQPCGCGCGQPQCGVGAGPRRRQSRQ